MRSALPCSPDEIIEPSCGGSYLRSRRPLRLLLECPQEGNGPIKHYEVKDSEPVVREVDSQFPDVAFDMPHIPAPNRDWPLLLQEVDESKNLGLRLPGELRYLCCHRLVSCLVFVVQDLPGHVSRIT